MGEPLIKVKSASSSNEQDIQDIVEILGPSANDGDKNDILACCEMALDLADNENSYIVRLGSKPIAAYEFSEDSEDDKSKTAIALLYIKEHRERYSKRILQCLEWSTLSRGFNQVAVLPENHEEAETLSKHGYKKEFNNHALGVLQDANDIEAIQYTKSLSFKII